MILKGLMDTFKSFAVFVAQSAEFKTKLGNLETENFHNSTSEGNVMVPPGAGEESGGEENGSHVRILHATTAIKKGI